MLKYDCFFKYLFKNIFRQTLTTLISFSWNSKPFDKIVSTAQFLSVCVGKWNLVEWWTLSIYTTPHHTILVGLSVYTTPHHTCLVGLSVYTTPHRTGLVGLYISHHITQAWWVSVSIPHHITHAWWVLVSIPHHITQAWWVLVSIPHTTSHKLGGS